MNRLLGLALLAGYASGVGVIVVALMPPDSTTLDSVPAAEITLPSLTPPGSTIGPVESYAAITERPLFLKGRTPPLEPSAAATPTPEAATPVPSAHLDGLRLTAVFREGDERRALIETASAESLTVSKGDQVQSWQVVEIRDTELILGLRGQQRTLQVHDFSQLEPARVAPRIRAVTERQRTIQRRPPENSRNNPPAPRQRRDTRDEEREDD